MSRPDYVKCIQKDKYPPTSYCGKIQEDWMFKDLAHAELVIKQDGSQEPCPNCLILARQQKEEA